MDTEGVVSDDLMLPKRNNSLIAIDKKLYISIKTNPQMVTVKSSPVPM